MSLSKPTTSVVPKDRVVVFDATTAVQQDFAFPAPIMHYIAMNLSSPELYEKLIRTCKYFFIKNPMLAVKRMVNDIICTERRKCYIDQPCGKCLKVDVSKLRIPIWVTDTLNFEPPSTFPSDNDHDIGIPQISELFQKKCIRSDATCCYFGSNPFYKTRMNLEELEYYAGNAEYVNLDGLQLVDSCGDFVKLDAILEALPKVKKFILHSYYRYTVINDSVLRSLSVMENLEQLEYICISSFPTNINISVLDKFVRNFCKRGKLEIKMYGHNELDEGYKNQLDQLVSKLIEDGVKNRMIYYYGMKYPDERLFFD